MGELCSRTSKSTSAKSLFSLCAPHCLNEFAHQAPIFLAGTRFDAARDVNPVGAHDANRRRHVLDLQPTRQNDTVLRRRAPRHIPIRGAAATTILAGVHGIKWKRKGQVVLLWRCQPNRGCEAASLAERGHRVHFGRGVRVFVAMALDSVDAVWFS